MTEGSSSDISDAAREDLRLLYQLIVQDLAFFKQQQWSTTNYVLLLHASLVGVVQLTGATTQTWERVLVCTLATVAGLVGAAILAQLQHSIKARRDRLGHVLQRFSSEFHAAWDTPAKAPDSPMIVLALGGALLVGVAVVWWLTWRIA